MKTEIIKPNKLTLTIIHCLTPLFIGSFLYLIFRTTTLRMFKWFEFLELDPYIFLIRNELFHFKQFLPPFIYYSLPDGLWVYSFTSSLIIFWDNEFKKVKYWLLIPFIIGVIVEILQGLKLFPGTFDYLDLTFSALGLLLSKIIINHRYKQNEKQIL